MSSQASTRQAAEGKGSNRKQGKNQMVFLAGDDYRERP